MIAGFVFFKDINKLTKYDISCIIIIVYSFPKKGADNMISVLMLTYNREQLVGRAIKSILEQTYENFELIVVNNGSTDRSGEIAESYAEKDPRIKVIHRERGNIGAGRNTALDAAKGEYITFMDDDDWVEPDFLEFLLNLITENNADMSICGAADKIFDEKKIMTTEEALIELMWRKKYNVAFPTKMFCKKISENLRFPEDGAFDDIALMYKLIAKAETIAYHGLPKYTFCRHNGNNSAWTTNHKLISPLILEEYLSIYRERTEWLSERFPNYAAAFRYFEWSFMISMVEKINRLELSDCGEQLKYMSDILRKNCEEFLSSPEILDFEQEWVKKYINGGCS